MGPSSQQQIDIIEMGITTCPADQKSLSTEKIWFRRNIEAVYWKWLGNKGGTLLKSCHSEIENVLEILFCKNKFCGENIYWIKI